MGSCCLSCVHHWFQNADLTQSIVMVKDKLKCRVHVLDQSLIVVANLSLDGYGECIGRCILFHAQSWRRVKPILNIWHCVGVFHAELPLSPPEHPDHHQAVPGVLSSVHWPCGSGWREARPCCWMHQSYPGLGIWGGVRVQFWASDHNTLTHHQCVNMETHWKSVTYTRIVPIFNSRHFFCFVLHIPFTTVVDIVVISELHFFTGLHTYSISIVLSIFL